MSMLPAGMVTFLFTDIEGSTPLWEHHPRAMRDSLDRHHSILHETIGQHDGSVFQIIGDAFCAAFQSPSQAIAAAVEAQRLLLEGTWGETGPLRIRMGIHTGPAEIKENEYSSNHTLNRVARIMSCGHGSQILISAAVAELAKGQLAKDISYKDLGEHYLKGLTQPEHIYQVSAPGLRDEFPALKSLGHALSFLPLPLTSLIGRVRELEALKRLVDKYRLVTLTGPGGSGKTHLSLVAARELSGNFKDGVYFIPLESLSDANFVTANVARALGLRERSDEEILITLKKHLQSKQSLLILDNFEQLMPAAPVFADLLETCPQISLLFTSREALHLSGEQLLPVPPMSLPDPHQIQEVIDLTQFEAVELFVERAQAFQPDFSVTVENAKAIAEVCILLDGLPLAIELAAARVRMLSPQAMLNVMRERNRIASLRLLTHGSREKQARQQTLRATIDWSYQLLEESEKLFFRRLAVFVGGFSMTAADTVCNPVNDPELPGLKVDVLDGIEVLIDKNLIRPDLDRGGEPRYTMLKTIQEYAFEVLENHQEAEALLKRHAFYCLSLASTAEKYLETDQQAVWFDRLEADHGNMMAALSWAIHQGNAKIGFEIAIPIRIFWFVRGYLTEGRAILDRLLLIRNDDDDPLLRAKALDRAGFLARYQKDYERAITLIHESLEIYREFQDPQGEADALANLGFIMLWQGDFIASEKYYQESLKIYERLNNQQGMADSLVHYALGNYYQGNYASAQEKVEKSLAIWEKLGDQQGIAYALQMLGNVYLQQGLLPSAQKALSRSLGLSKAIGFQLGIAWSLEGQARLATMVGNYKVALQLYGAAKAVRQQFGLPMSVSEQEDIEVALRPAYLFIKGDDVQISLEQGHQANLDDLIHSVLSDFI